MKKALIIILVMLFTGCLNSGSDNDNGYSKTEGTVNIEDIDDTKAEGAIINTEDAEAESAILNTEDAETEGPINFVDDIKDNSNDDESKKTEISQLYLESAALLAEALQVKQDIFFPTFEERREAILRELAAAGRLRGGASLGATADEFETMLYLYLLDIRNDILVIYSNGFLLKSIISSELTYTQDVFLEYIDRLIPDSDDDSRPSRAAKQVKTELQDTINNAYQILIADLQVQGIEL